MSPHSAEPVPTLTQLKQPEKQMLESLFQQPDLFTVCKGEDETDPKGISRPPDFKWERVGFSDFSPDSDQIPRRQLLAAHKTNTDSPRCPSIKSFNLLIAESYLQKVEKIQTSVNTSEEGCQINFSTGVALANLKPNTGGYQGYSGEESSLFYDCQILINYRDQPENQSYKTVTLEEFLKSDFPVNDYTNRIILIGINRSDGFGDNWKTPYDQGLDQFTTGVMLQAQMIEQIIDVASRKNSLIWVLPSGLDLFLVLSFALLGGGLGWWVQSPRQLGILVVLSGGGFLLISIVAFQLGGWIPLMPHFLALSATSSSVFWFNARLRSVTPKKT